MNVDFSLNKKKLLLGLICYYTIICLFSFTLHNHRPDLNFHDTCPACQWEIQYQEDFSAITSILDAFHDALIFYDIQSIPFFIDIPKQDYAFNTLSRAPPQHV